MIVLIVIAVTVRVPNRAGMIAYENNNIVDSSDRTLAV